MSLKNNIENAEFFKRYVKGARLARGKGIPNKNIIHLNVMDQPQIKVLANIQGSNNAKYVIDISEENGIFTIIHDCPDFKKGFNLCKHVVKVLLLVNPQVCKSICKNVSGIKFSSNLNLIKKSKTENYTSKAEELLKDSKYYEAIAFLEQAYTESKDFSCIEKIKEISLQNKLYDQFLKFSTRFNDLVVQNYTKLPEIINYLLTTLDKFDFSKQNEITGNLNTLLNSFTSEQFTELFQSLQINALSDEVLKFFLLNKLPVQIEMNKYFPERLKDSKISLINQMEQLILYSVKEAILNMDSIENVEAYLKIADACNLSERAYIRKIVGDYRENLKAMFLEGLKKKHAYLRSLVIENYHSDKLTSIKFSTKYNYPTLVWASTRRNESPLYYYVIQKCGIEKHHLDYTDRVFFTENFPVYKEIFDGNNPIEYMVKDFWDTDDPKIKNVVKTNRIVEVNYQINIEDLEKYVLVEWDLAQRPILGSYICQFSDGFMIPDINHPLTNDIEPFDLILCYKKPIEIKAGNLKVLRPVQKLNFKTAVELVWKGLECVSSYIPFEIITKLKNYKIDELDAYDHIEEQFKTCFLPDKDKIKRAFFKFIQIKILKELNQIYLSVLEKPDYKKKVLRMIGLERYSTIFTNTKHLSKFKQESLKRDSLQILKVDLKNEIGKILTRLIKEESYNEVNLKKLKNYPIFRKWALKIIMEQKKKLEKCKIYKDTGNQYDVHEFASNYYGKIILEDLAKNGTEIDYESKPDKVLIEESGFDQLIENYEFLKINPPKIVKSK